MEHNCILCSHRHSCSESGAFVYALNPILRQIVRGVLEEMNFEFSLEGDLFRLEADHAAAINYLRKKLSDAERADIRVSREKGAGLFAAQTLDNYGHRIDTQWFEDALGKDAFTTFFQPIVDTRDLSVFAHECLIRLFADRPYNGGEIIDAAVSRGSMHLFDSYSRRLAVRKAGPQYVPGTKVFINFMPSSIYDPALCMSSTMEEISHTSLKPKDIVFEVVESDEVSDVKHLQKICAYYRKEGFGFALDDVGTGSNSLQMVCDLKPDFIKLDKSLISRISEPMYRSVVEKLAEFAGQFGLHVIAEGIETFDTWQSLRGIGIHLMQGYYFGKPAANMVSHLDIANRDLTQISGHLNSSVRQPISVQ